MIGQNLIPFRNMDIDSPWKMFQDLEREMNRVFQDYMPEARGRNTQNQNLFTPTCDVDENEDHYMISVDLPGVKKDDIRVEIKDGQLLIAGERKSEHKEKDKNRRYFERSYGSFSRVFTLPQNVDGEKIEANFENGVLSLYVPKTEASKPRKIAIGTDKKGFFDKLKGLGKNDTHRIETKERMQDSA